MQQNQMYQHQKHLEILEQYSRPHLPTPKPGFKPLTEGPKGAFIGGASAICAAALKSGDFYLGLACAFMLVVGGIIINRPHH